MLPGAKWHTRNDERLGPRGRSTWSRLKHRAVSRSRHRPLHRHAHTLKPLFSAPHGQSVDPFALFACFPGSGQTSAGSHMPPPASRPASIKALAERAYSAPKREALAASTLAPLTLRPSARDGPRDPCHHPYPLPPPPVPPCPFSNPPTYATHPSIPPSTSQGCVLLPVPGIDARARESVAT